jgi:hypothetical protein
MKCYECALASKTVDAVAVCRHCGVGLCLEHLRETRASGLSGAFYGCQHQATVGERLRRRGADGNNAGDPRVQDR